jgi:LysM repeat protein
MIRFGLILICALLTSYCISAKPLDSLRVEVIKGSKFIIHKVEKNETLASIVKRYRTTTAEITKHNDIKNNKVEKGQVLRIPLIIPDAVVSDSNSVDEAHANAQAQEVQKVYTHVVAAGENLNTIAKKYKISTAQITKWNALRTSKIITGQVLIVDENAVAKPYIRLNSPEAQLPQAPQQPLLAKADMVEETGLAAIGETMQVAHADAPPGTIIKVVNLENNLQCLVRVTDKLDAQKYQNFIITIGKEVQEKLKADGATLRVKLVYALKP